MRVAAGLGEVEERADGEEREEVAEYLDGEGEDVKRHFGGVWFEVVLGERVERRVFSVVFFAYYEMLRKDGTN